MELARAAGPTFVQVVTRQQHHLHHTRWDPPPEGPPPRLPFPLRLLFTQGRCHLIKSIQEAQKCEHCGRIFQTAHTCSVRRRDFYFHHVQRQTADWWQTIAFRPIGSPEGTRRLFLTYDLETYTWHGRFGKQLVPFLLVFHLSGDEELLDAALQVVAVQSPAWQRWEPEPHTFYMLCPQKRAIGRAFKALRHALQARLTDTLWQHLLAHNPDLAELAQERGPGLPDDPEDPLAYAQLRRRRLRGPPLFLEVYIVGHNISGFDEIVLAAQVLAHRREVPPSFLVTRTFMPRNGRILFNDISFNLPNPAFRPRRDYADWEEGVMAPEDPQHQYVKFMVRDTFALTHTSLRKAAAAYELAVDKGHCPYEAVNEFYRTGDYLRDQDGFPHAKYWDSDQEYLLNKDLWKKESQGDAYDIVQATLRYCAQDVVVTARLVRKLQESYRAFVHTQAGLPHAAFNVFQRPTISSNSHAIFKQLLYRASRPQAPHLGRDLLAPSHELYDYVRESLRGGRCYPTFIGLLQEPLYVYDICGMYASALTHPFPAGQPLNPFDRALAARRWQDRLDGPEPLSYFDPDLLPALFTIDADPPDEDQLDVLPPYCSRKGGRLCWTNEPLRGEVATSVDVVTLHNRGWAVRLLPDERTTIFPEWRCLARDYVQLNIAAKEKADRDRNQTLRSIAKLLSNALYGSFATRLDNKKVVFASQMDARTTEAIARGDLSVRSSAFIETDNLSAEVTPDFVVAYPPEDSGTTDAAAARDAGDTDADSGDEACEPTDGHAPRPAPFIPPDPQAGHVDYHWRPIHFLDADDEDLCLHTLEQASPLVPNDRYPSQVASFVLAWARAFISEWALILYADDRGTPIADRPLRSVYGDTDSLFLTRAGRELMETKGKHRLKRNGGPLVFDPQNPQLTWLVECETQCERCRSDAHSSETVLLAPKLYALRDTVCDACGHRGPGKLRAKGHATQHLSYDLLRQCYLNDAQLGSATFSTSRLSLKRTLATEQPQTAPFTVTETTLTRSLRPWKDRTLHPLDAHRLVPYSRSNPNPRNNQTCWRTIPWDM